MTRNALVVGINKYPFLEDTSTNPAKNLTAPARSAEDIAVVMETHGDFCVKRLPASIIDGKMQVDPDKTLNAQELEAAILDLFLPETGKPPETGLLFFAGHGLRKQLRTNWTEGFLATSDANPRKQQWGLDLEWLLQILQRSQVRQQIIWLDCCFSGELLNFKDTELGRHSSACDRFLIAASRDCEVAYQQFDGKHGVLTEALLTGLDPDKIPEYEWLTNHKLAVDIQQNLQAYYHRAKIPQTPLISNHGETIKLIQGRNRQQQNSPGQPAFNSEITNSKNICKYSLQEAGNIFELPFFGRRSELEELQQLIVQRKYPLVSLIGMAGIGKTRLAAKLTENIKDKFQYVIWKNLRTVPCFEVLLNDLLNFLSVNSSILPSPSTDRIKYLISYLETHQCLLILDDLTEVLDESDVGKIYKQGWQQFGRFLELAMLQANQSSILITCHEIPHNLFNPKIDENCCKFNIQGLNLSDIQANFNAFLYALPGAEYDWESFVNYYGGNPGLIEMAARWISNEYDGNISKYLEDNCRYASFSSTLKEIHEILDKQFKKLSRDEQQVMYLLAIKTEPLKLAKIKSLLSNKHISIKKLTNYSLVQETAYGYTQVHMVMDYVTERIVNKVVDEICTQDPQLINDIPLFGCQDKDYIKDIQKRRIVQPIIEKLLQQNIIGGQEPVQERLHLMLANWRRKQPKNGYMGGNIINILLQMDADLRNSDFSNIPLGYAELQNKEVHNVNLSNSYLSHASFSEDLGCIHSIVFGIDGRYFATADANGNIRLWQTNTCKQVNLFNDEQSSSQIWSIAFKPNENILASAGSDKTIRLWDVATGDKINEIKDNQCGYSVTFSFDGKILVSAGDERIAIWNAISGNLHQQIIIPYPVNSIAINRNSILAAACQDGTVRTWDIKDVTHPKPLHIWREHYKTVRCVIFNCDDNTVASGSEDGTIKLWKLNSNGSFKTLNASEIKQVWTLAFSQDGKILASGSSDENPSGIDEHHNIRLWDIDNGECFQKLGAHENQLRTVAFFPQPQQSHVLISGGDDRAIKIWDVNTGKRHKTIKGYTNRKPYEGMNIFGVKGLNDAQISTLIALGAVAE